MRFKTINREKLFASAEITEKVMKNYLKSIGNATDLWHLKYSSENGRGVYASSDIPYGSVIFIDKPLVTGPRLSAHLNPICTVCYRKSSDLMVCEKKCGLPVCSVECGVSDFHLKDCNILQMWMQENSTGFEKWSVYLLRALTAVRGLQLSDESMEVLLSLQGHVGEQHGMEIQFLKTEGLNPSEEEEEYLRNVCCVLDTNAFESVVKSPDNETISLRALYPMGSLLNHSCIPNTTHLFDSSQQMIVKTTRLIRANEEITTTYTNLLWGTVTRRHNLFTTKHFLCHCERCLNLTEFDCPLSALYCIKMECRGFLLPRNYLDFKADWECKKCGNVVPVRKIGMIQSTLGTMMHNYYSQNVDVVKDFLRDRLSRIVPPCSQLVVEIKLRLIALLGTIEGYKWEELTAEILDFKEEMCREIIKIVEQLRLGGSKMKGFLIQQLFLTLEEKQKRNGALVNEKEMCELKAAAIGILDGDIRLTIKI